MRSKIIVVGLTGPNASGKGEVSRYLKKKGFAYHSLSDIIRDETKSSSREESPEPCTSVEALQAGRPFYILPYNR